MDSTIGRVEALISRIETSVKGLGLTGMVHSGRPFSRPPAVVQSVA